MHMYEYMLRNKMPGTKGIHSDDSDFIMAKQIVEANQLAIEFFKENLMNNVITVNEYDEIIRQLNGNKYTFEQRLPVLREILEHLI